MFWGFILMIFLLKQYVITCIKNTYKADFDF